MQQNTTDTRPSATRPSAGRASTDPAAAAPAPDLTVNKVVAGAGAAATSAVLGSSFGAAGTVVGAAIGSVASTIAASIYQRSLDRTRDTVVARIRTSRRDPDATVRLPPDASDDATVLLPVVPAPGRRRRRRWVIGIVGTVLVFLLGLLAVTGLEWIKGSTVSTGQPGTSVGRVLNPAPAPVDDGAGVTEPAPDATTPEPSAERTPEPSGAAEPSTEPPAEGTTPDGFSGGTPGEGGSDPDQVEPTPAPAPAQSPPIGP